tara:strand:- start:59 stop:259 length:201 start_codon:yes stop_codon:yes gene_type:complete
MISRMLGFPAAWELVSPANAKTKKTVQSFICVEAKLYGKTILTTMLVGADLPIPNKQLQAMTSTPR